MKIQSILFKKPFYNLKKVKQFLYKKNITPLKYDITPNYIRTRLIKPNKKYKYRIYTVNDNIKMVLII